MPTQTKTPIGKDGGPPLLCFIHVEKAGGTTIHNMIKYGDYSYQMIRSWSLTSNAERESFTARELKALNKLYPRLRGIGGHTVRSFLNYEEAINRPVFYFTFLREPISRYMSQFNYQRLVMDIRWKIEDFIDDDQLSNFQTKKIAGKADIDAAKQALKNQYGFVGLQQHYDQSLLLLKSICGDGDLNILYEKLNVINPGKDVIRYDGFSDEIKNRIKENNKLDLELYKFVTEELYPQYVESYEGNLTADTEAFKKENKKFHYNPGKRILLKSINALSFYGVQPLIRKIYK